MQPFSNRQIRIFIFGLLLLSMLACVTNASQPTATNAPHNLSEGIPPQTLTALNLPTATLPPTSTPTLTATPLPTATETPLPSNTPLPPTPTITPIPPGASLPQGQAIGLDNYQQLGIVAQFGKGIIRDVAYTPDGESFIVGTPFGFAVYSAQEPETAPKWVKFDTPYFYYNLYISQDGQYVRLEFSSKTQIRSLEDGTIVNAAGLEWFKPITYKESWGSIDFTSNDGQMQLKSSVLYNEEFMDIEYSIRKVFNPETEELLYELPDATMYVNFEDSYDPEACDFDFFSPCGNALSPNAMHPHRGGFSPSNDTLAIVYRAPNLVPSDDDFSVLRLYRATDGALLYQIGDFEHGVTSFEYSPDGTKILVAYTSGEIEIRRVSDNSILFNSWDFSAPIRDIDYSTDKQFLILTKENYVEILRAEDGSVVNRYPATVLAISPTQNHIALGGKDGRLQLVDLNINRTLFNIQAHDDKVLALAFSPDGKNLTSSSLDCTVRSWKADTGGFLYSFTEVSAYFPIFDMDSRLLFEYLKYIPDTNQLIGFGTWNHVASWDTHTAREQYVSEEIPHAYYSGMQTIHTYYPEYFSIDYENQIFLPQ